MGIFDRLKSGGNKFNLDVKLSDKIKYTMKCVDGRKSVIYVQNNPYELRKFEDSWKDNPYWVIEKKELVRKR